MAKNKLWTVIKILLAVAAIGVAVYAIYRKFFQKSAVAQIEETDECDAPELDASEAGESDGAAEDETVEISAEDVIANAEAMEA